MIEDYLDREEKQQWEGKALEEEQRVIERVKPVISEELQRLRARMAEIDRIHLN